MCSGRLDYLLRTVFLNPVLKISLEEWYNDFTQIVHMTEGERILQ